MKKRLVSLITLFAMPMTAMAHEGHQISSLMSGFLHPLTGIDHLLVMLAIGFWASRSVGQLRWQVPATFISFLLLGLSFGTVIAELGFMEAGISLSLLAMAMVLSLLTTLNPMLKLGLTTVFAFMHGIAHGQELLMSENGMLAITGLLITTIALLSVGLYLGRFKDRVGSYLNGALVSSLTLGGAFFLLSS
ncbi:HupE/UreJ family protein [Methylophaga sp.]|uniref:HupE/UreJ family protein n=1 Tax=Methylophaga sp. TaxID=2024840 RepID=UPI003F69C5D4